MKHLLIIILSLANLTASAQVESKFIYTSLPLIPYRNKNLWGLCDYNKNILVKPQFEKLEAYKSSYYMGIKKGVVYYINYDGKIFNKAQFAAYLRNQNSTSFESANEAQSGNANVSGQWKKNFDDDFEIKPTNSISYPYTTKEKEKCSIKFDSISYLNANGIQIWKGNQFNFVDTNCKVALPFFVNEVKHDFSTSLLFVLVKEKKYYLFRTDSMKIIKNEYDSIYTESDTQNYIIRDKYTDKPCFLKKGNKIGLYIIYNGREFYLEPVYDAVFRSSNEYFIYIKNDTVTGVDITKGEQTTIGKVKVIESLRKGLFYKIANKFGHFSTTTKFNTGAKFDKIFTSDYIEFDAGQIAIKVIYKGKIGYINDLGTEYWQD